MSEEDTDREPASELKQERILERISAYLRKASEADSVEQKDYEIRSARQHLAVFRDRRGSEGADSE